MRRGLWALFGFALSLDVDRLIYDQDQTAASRALIREFEASRFSMSTW